MEVLRFEGEFPLAQPLAPFLVDVLCRLDEFLPGENLSCRLLDFLDDAIGFIKLILAGVRYPYNSQNLTVGRSVHFPVGYVTATIIAYPKQESKLFYLFAFLSFRNAKSASYSFLSIFLTSLSLTGLRVHPGNIDAINQPLSVTTNGLLPFHVTSHVF